MTLLPAVCDLSAPVSSFGSLSWMLTLSHAADVPDRQEDEMCCFGMIEWLPLCQNLDPQSLGHQSNSLAPALVQTF